MLRPKISAVISSFKNRPLRQVRDFLAIAISGQGLPALPMHLWLGASLCARRLLHLLPRGFPDPTQWTVSAVNWIVIGNWQSCDGLIGFWTFARKTAKQIPVASIRVSSHHTKIRARTDVVMRDARRNENEVAGADLDGLAVLYSESQFCSVDIDTERLV